MMYNILGKTRTKFDLIHWKKVATYNKKVLTPYKIISEIYESGVIFFKLSDRTYNIVGKTHSKFDLI